MCNKTPNGVLALERLGAAREVFTGRSKSAAADNDESDDAVRRTGEDVVIIYYYYYNPTRNYVRVVATIV